MTLKVWDVAMEARPVAVIPIHEYLKVHLCDLYENDWLVRVGTTGDMRAMCGGLVLMCLLFASCFQYLR